VAGVRDGAAADVKAVREVVDELLDGLVVDVADDNLLDVSDRGDGLQLRVRLDARADDAEGTGVLDGEVVGGDGGGRAGALHREFGAVHERERVGVLRVGVHHRPHYGREVEVVGVVGVDVHPLDAGGVPGPGVEVGGHRPEVAVVLREVDVGLRGHLGVPVLVGGERVLDRRYQLRHRRVDVHVLLVEQQRLHGAKIAGPPLRTSVTRRCRYRA